MEVVLISEELSLNLPALLFSSEPDPEPDPPPLLPDPLAVLRRVRIRCILEASCAVWSVSEYLAAAGETWASMAAWHREEPRHSRNRRVTGLSRQGR